MVKIPQRSREDIVRGSLTDSARMLADIHDLEIPVVARILKEISDQLFGFKER